MAVSDFARSNVFYRDVLGAEIVEIDGRIAYRIGGQQLNVHGPGVQPAMVARIPVTPGIATCASSGTVRSLRRSRIWWRTEFK